jgi:hypothetical protein
MEEAVQRLEEIKALLETLIEKTQYTNEILKRGIKIQWGHNMSVLDMDSDRFKKSEQMRNHPPK